ncbi:MAG: hypothetical protein ACR2F6_18795 [Mycobacteriales bacterium]
MDANSTGVAAGQFGAETGLTEMPVLWSSARRLVQPPGFGDSVDVDRHIKRQYHGTHETTNPARIVPKGPDLDGWTAPVPA